MDGERDHQGQVSRSSSLLDIARTGSLAGEAQKRRFGTERVFLLDEIKLQVLDKLKKKLKVQRRFLEFYHTDLFDDICKALLIYFVAKLEHTALENGRLKGQEPGKLEAIQQAMNNKSPGSLESEMKAKLTELCPLYAKVLMKYSNYSNLVTDKVFFETFYESMSLIMQLSLEVPNSLSYKKEIDSDLGYVFRTQFFNTRGRDEGRDKLVDTLTIRDLYKLRHETDQTTMNAKMVSALYERPKVHNMHESYGAKSDMIAYLLARGTSPDRELRTLRNNNVSPPRQLPKEQENSELTARAAVRNALGLPEEDGPRVLLLGFHEVNQLELVYRNLMGYNTGNLRRGSVRTGTGHAAIAAAKSLRNMAAARSPSRMGSREEG